MTMIRLCEGARELIRYMASGVTQTWFDKYLTFLPFMQVFGEFASGGSSEVYRGSIKWFQLELLCFIKLQKVKKNGFMLR